MAKSNNGLDKKPDFDYPKTVLADANSRLSVAMRKGDGDATVKYLIQSSLAQSMITTDNAQQTIERIDSVAHLEKKPVTRALLYHLEALMLQNFYRRNAYEIGQRKTLDGVTDMTEWSTKQFTARITELIKLSLADKKALQAAPIATIAELIDKNEHTPILYPTVYDMIAWQSIRIADNIDNDAIVADIFASLKTQHANDVAPYIYACDQEMKQNENPARLDSLKSLYKKHIDTTDMAYFAINGFDDDPDKERYAIYQDFVARYPKSLFSGMVKNEIASLENKRVNIKFPRQITSKDSLNVECEVTNADKLTLYVFRLSDNAKGRYYFKKKSDLKLVATKTQLIEGTVPFSDTVNVAMPSLPYGRYAVYCDIKGVDVSKIFSNIKNRSRLEVFTVTDIALFSATEKDDECRIFAVNAITGAPLKNVKIKELRSMISQSTNDRGFVTFKREQSKEFRYGSLELEASLGDDKFSNFDSYMLDKRIQSDINVDLFTDLGVYRPGEKVQFTAICYNTSHKSMSVVAGKKMRLDFMDSNSEEIDSLICTTDDMGRIEGSFLVPRDRMNGTFQIRVSLMTTEKGKEKYRYECSRQIEVSEYKVPTFFITTDDRRKFEKGKDVVITGKATTFTEMPVGGAKLVAEISKQEAYLWWRFGDDQENIMTLEAITDADGSFSITIPADSIPAEVENNNSWWRMITIYNANISVTNAAGETQTADKQFSFSNNCVIAANGKGDFTFCADKDIELPIAVDCTDESQKFRCQYTVCDIATGAEVASGDFNPKSPVITLSSVKSGKYRLNVSAIYDAKFTTEIVIYHSADKMPPVESPLWMPSCAQSVDKNNNVTLLLGNTNADSHIYLLATSRDKVIFDGWLNLKPGMHTLKYKIPMQEYDFIDFKFITAYNGELYTKEFSLASQYKPNAISIKPIAFRDHLTPGAPEQWTFQLLNAKGKPAQGAMFCAMYDKAINQIEPNVWSLSPRVSRLTTSVLGKQHFGSAYDNFAIWADRNYSTINISRPELYLYGVYPFSPRFNRRYMKMSNMASSSDGGLYEYAAAPEAVAVENTLGYRSKGAVAENDEISSKDESAEEINHAALDKVVMREADVKTALWRPSLRTDKEGNVFVEFDAPQFNTTWVMQAIAYTADLHTAKFMKDVITQKPIMVRASLPRFVRQGDKASLAASLMNATDSTQQCSAVIELFDTNSHDIIATKSFNITLAPKATEAIAIEWEVPDTLAFVGYRVKAATGEFGDGEQTALPVLTAISPIIETKPFFIDAATPDFALNLPKFPKGSRVTLEYCDNPVWYCVTALPNIKTDNYMTASALAHSLYALTLAEGIANGNPDIREAVNYWNANEGDSTLVSNLAKNSELKIGTLLASPWLREADRQTLRMKSISDLFDPAKTDNEMNKILTRLEELQLSDGGWTWFKYRNCKSSYYVTGEVLELIGELRHLGYLKDNDRINKMIRRALPYYDGQTLENFNKRYNKKDYTGLSDFVYIRSMYKDIPMAVATKSLHDKALKAMKTEWKGLSLPSKAYFALALYRNNEAKTAKDIIRSLREFSITKPETGMYWDAISYGWNAFFSKTAITSTMLQAFAEIDPKSADIDQIRKWMLLDKQVNDWDNSSLASDAVYALLSSGSKWLGKQSPAEIAVGNVKVESSKADQYLGYFKRTLDVNTATESLMTVKRDGTSPAWGALYCQYSAPMTEVKAAKVNALSIEKETYVATGDRLVKTDKMRVGDRVQVRFVIKNSRDLEYVTLNDERAACTEPIDQVSEYRYLDGTGFYMEVKDDLTRLFFNYLPKGTHVITYDLHITAPGEYNVGIATIQSQYAPQIAAHSKGNTIKVTNN